MRVLLVKMSSLGDLIHTLPALEDAVRVRPQLRFDWVVEEDFADIPALHRAVDRVIPIAFRRWRKRPLRALFGPEWRAARAALRQRKYAAVIDAQGLLKSAVVARLVRAPRCGPDRASARESLAAFAYDHPVSLPRQLHAVQRTRLLFARALAYPPPTSTGEYGLDAAALTDGMRHPAGLVFCHGSARSEKLWPEQHWATLARTAREAGYRVWLPWGSEEERQRAGRIAHATGAQVLPRMGLRQLAGLLHDSPGAVAVDTGLGHLAAALSRPCVSLYGPTRSDLVGTYGRCQVHLQSPLAAGATTASGQALMAAIEPAAVWRSLRDLLAGAG